MVSLRPKLSRIAIKMIVFAAGLMLISLSVFSFVFMSSEMNKLSDDVLNDALVFAEFTSSSIYDDYVREYTHIHSQQGFEGFRNDIAEKMSKNSDIAKISLVGTNGKILFDSGEFSEGKVYEGPSRYVDDDEIMELVKRDSISYIKRSSNGDELAEIAVPITEESGGHFVSVWYTLSYKSLKERIADDAARAVSIIIPIMLLIVVFSVIFSLTITRPIVKLKKLAERISKGISISR